MSGNDNRTQEEERLLFFLTTTHPVKNHGLFYLYKGFYALVCSILYLMGEERSMIFREHVVLVMQLCWTLCDHTKGRNARLLYPWDSPGKNTGVDCHCLLHMIMLAFKDKEIYIEHIIKQWTLNGPRE